MSLESVSVREMQPSDLEGVFEAYGQAFGAEALLAFRKRYAWEFLDNPRAPQSPSRSWVAVTASGAIVGHIASFPMLLKLGDQEVMTSSSGDLLVANSARGQGIGELVSKAYRDGAGLLATDGFGYQPITGRIYQRLGYEQVSCVPVYVRPMDLSALYRFVGSSSRLPRALRMRSVVALGAWILGIANLPLAVVNRIRQPKPGGNLTVGEMQEATQEVDALWKRISPNLPIAFVRDYAFVKWRYFDDPIARHTVLEARERDGTLCGFLVYSMSEKPSLRLARLMDLCCSPDRLDVIDSLMASFLGRIRAEGAGAAICWGLHEKIRARVQRYLYVRPRGEEAGTLLYCTGDEAMKHAVFTSSNWHVARADGDEGLAP